MRRIVVIVAGLSIVAGVLAVPAAAQANPHSVRNPLSISGSVVAGVTSVQGGQAVAFAFTEKNHGSTPVTVDFEYTLMHARAADIICPLVSTGADINPDGNFCEPGSLAGHSSTQSAIEVKAPSSPGTVVVFACTGDEDNGAPVKCTSLSVPDVG